MKLDLPLMATLRGWRFVGFVSCIVGAIGITLYPVVVDPMINSKKYKSLQEHISSHAK
ncbi:uncharacterized protein Dmoj_GI26365, isoform A [Drosophila mojavensis]|uniref:Uncharacterized protein, isoform A n=3 Tax=mojavensis species complex TaxID=198037 RepID=A0A0Q9XEA6_DROMO|nr:uncharacterized protein Dmoj_GI26365, isoform A [Drosophila mojavensis]